MKWYTYIDAIAEKRRFNPPEPIMIRKNLRFWVVWSYHFSLLLMCFAPLYYFPCLGVALEKVHKNYMHRALVVSS